MTIDEYTEKAISTLLGTHAYGKITPTLIAQVLGLCGESGEVAEKFKKLIRDKQGEVTEADRQELLKELGDVLWYVTAVAHLLDSSLEEVAQLNNAKLASRRDREQLAGSGDNR
ncbi:MAG: nucleoside triphosphate pyrophosphohydrolase family protein [Candidatus Saccharibacteria bacterium]|nr:nucleoside triphosphate pyrophosphohydrolase family protein [Candidatus Saccharibacteria bacterium]